MISNSKRQQTGNGASNGTNGEDINSIHEIYRFLEEPMRGMNLAPGGNPYDHIVEMIRGLDLQDDGIMMNQKIKAIETDFCNIVHDENMLCESMNYINAKALDDGEIALKFALLFSSRNFDALAMKETKVRSAMLKILETNFLNADTFRMYDKERLYNSITILGEYYNRVRLADNSPITILGESLIGLLVREIQCEEIIDSKFAKLVLSQMTLNGDIMRARHQSELTQLLYYIRRHLVEQTKLSSTTKALLLMTLDLYYSNFANLGTELETFYTKYLVHEDQDEGNNNQLQEQQKPEEQQQGTTHNVGICTEQENRDTNYDFSVPQPTTKKWSEQVCEDSLFESEYNQDTEGLDESHSTTASDRLNSNSTEQKNSPSHQKDSRNIRRLPRPLKYAGNDKRGSREHLCNTLPQERNGEEDDQTKPLPRWRAARFNRDEEQNLEYLRNRFRRASGSFDDDHQSVHSEGGIRLYSVKDRQKHSQEKMERSSNYNFIVNSNWDRQSQRDDRSERSYISNYEYGNNQRRQKGGYRNYYNSRQNYDKPPRFQKNQKHQQQQQEKEQQEQQSSIKDNKNYNDNWRRARTNSNNSYNGEHDDARATTLPRPAKSNFEGSIKSASFRRSQSPAHQRELLHRNYFQQQQHRGVGNLRNFNGRRYGSQNSIHSEGATGTEDRHTKNQRHNTRGGRRFHPQGRRQQHTPERKMENWEQTAEPPSPIQHEPEVDELVRNARQTTKYMNYLSSQK